MKIISAPLLKEVLWLVFCMLVTTLLALLFFGSTFLNGTIDIHLVDTYLVMMHWHILLPMFLLITCIVFFIKESRHIFGRSIANGLLLLAGLSLIVALSLLIKTFAEIFTSFANNHPIAATETTGLSQSPTSTVINNFLVITQIVVAIMLLYVTFKWGSNKNTRQSFIKE